MELARDRIDELGQRLNVGVEFIFARGSGESLNSDTYRAWEDSLTSELDRELDRTNLMKKYTGVSVHDEATDSDFVLRFSV